MEITHQIKGLKELGDKLQRLTTLGRYALVPTVAKYALKIQGMARRLVPVDTGLTRASILTRFYGDKLTAEIGTEKAHARGLEEGTAPHQVPPEQLAGWARRKGMKPGAEYAIARNIARKGTKARPFLMPAYEENAPAFVDEAETTLKKDLNRLLKGA